MGHFASVCKTKVTESRSRSRVRYMEADDCQEGEDKYAFAVAGEVQGGMVTVNIGSILVKMIVDSGEGANDIGQILWEQLKKLCQR